MCNISEICIPNCKINEFYNSSIAQCIECNTSCTNGCRNQENCTLCVDPNCVSCSSYEVGSCVECENFYEVQNNSCQMCNASAYFDPLDKICKVCASQCASCSSLTQCLACDSNNHLNSTNQCECDAGYYPNDTVCERSYFFASISINSSNIATIFFTEDLENDLQANSIKVQVNSVSQDFVLQKNDNSSYSISVAFSSSINSGDHLQVIFMQSIVSASNSLLATLDLKSELFPMSYDNTAFQINQAQTYAQTATAVGLSVAFGSSCINLDPISFFNLLNNIDIYVSATLFQENIDPSLVAFLQTLSPNSMLPNTFGYFIDQSEGNQLDQRFSNSGYSTNLLILNSGQTLSIWVLLLVVFLSSVVLQASNSLWIKSQGKKLKDAYRFKVCLRFLLQSFLELSCNSVIGISFTTLSNNLQIIDFALCIFIAVTYI